MCRLCRDTPNRRATSVTEAPSNTSHTARYRCSPTRSSTSIPELLPQSITTTEEPTDQAPQQPCQRESVKHLPEPLSRSNRNCVPKPSSSYRNLMVKHEPELHRSNGSRNGSQSPPSPGTDAG